MRLQAHQSVERQISKQGNQRYHSNKSSKQAEQDKKFIPSLIARNAFLDYGWRRPLHVSKSP
jgi:hypothetical protein